jgi:hypothetical protein
MWKKHATLPWTEPLRFAQAHASGEMAFLYSGLEEPYTGGALDGPRGHGAAAVNREQTFRARR